MVSKKWVNPNHAVLFGSKQPNFAQDVESKYIPAPTGGWDAISPLSAMEPKYAVTLENWVPRPGWIELRGGYNAWVQALSSEPVSTLMTYRSSFSPQILFAATGANIYDVSTYGSPTLSLGGFQNDRFQFINFTPAGGSNFLYIVNGADSPRHFNGTIWATPSIVGVTPSTLINISAHKRRIWFIEVNSTRAWFLPTDAIQGIVEQLDLGSFMTKGGFLMAMGTWTIDGGNGPDDFAVFISSEGQAILYKGTDPANPNAWFLVGVFDLPKPLGRRCLTKFGSDLLYISLEGLLPISKALPFDPSGVRSVALTNRIQNEMLKAAQFGKNSFGWQSISFPQQSLLLMNVPITENENQNQFVMNSISGSWCRFIGWNAACFELYNDSLYFGDNDGNVNLAYAGGLDLVSPIVGDAKCAFNYFEDPGRNKIMQMIRPYIVADGSITPTIGVDFDYSDNSPVTPVTTLTPSGGIWDVDEWDEGIWSSGTVVVVDWLTVGAIGTALAVRMKINFIGGGVAGAAAASSVFDTAVFDTAVFDGSGAIVASGLGTPVLRLNAFEAIMEFGASI